ncbi:MAG: GNAT family N-acetyltransferase [Thaumarchaeota archaeon]|nr:GNAT family N-acetyltransferase [Nitrososphaerota archaeon]
MFFIRAWKESGPAAMGFTGANEEAIGVIGSKEFLSRRLASPNNRTVLAEEGGRVIGFASLRSTSGREAELTGFVVLQDSRGIGVGTRLLRKTVEVAKKRGCRLVTVRPEETNAQAIGLLKKAGFLMSRKSVEKVGRMKSTMQVMVLRLG